MELGALSGLRGKGLSCQILLPPAKASYPLTLWLLVPQSVGEAAVLNAENHHDHEAGQGCLNPEEASQRTLKARGQVNIEKAQPAAVKGRNAHLICDLSWAVIVPTSVSPVVITVGNAVPLQQFSMTILYKLINTLKT